MAKLKGAAKAAFLRRMARGRKAARKGRGSKARRRSMKRRNPLYARHDIDRGEKIHRSMVEKRANPRRRKRRKPARARKARRAKRRHVRRHHNPLPTALIVNPTGGTMARRRKHRKHARRSNPHKRRRHHRRHRNPMGGGIKGIGAGLVKSGITAVAAGAASSFVEAKFLGKQSVMVRALARAGMAVGAGMMLRGKPLAAATAIGAILGPIGGEQGTKMGGGLVLHGLGSMQALAEHIAENEDMALLLQDEMKGLGLILTSGTDGMGADAADLDGGMTGMGDEGDDA